MKVYLVLLIAFLSMVGYSQEKSIILHKKDSERTIEIAEHKRIKVVTADGTKYWGRFTVVDSASIMMKGKVIPLNSIVKIRRKTLVGAIATPVVVAFGILIIPTGLLAGAMVASMGSEAVAGAVIAGGSLVSGGAVITIPFISNNHPPSRDWEYAVKSNDKSGLTSNQIKVGQSESKEKSVGGKS